MVVRGNPAEGGRGHVPGGARREHSRQAGWERGPGKRCDLMIVALLAFGLAAPAGAQIEPVVVTFEQASVLQTSRMAEAEDGSVTYTKVSTRRATLEELRAAALGDIDQDGVVNLLDACPERADCGSADGSYAQLHAAEPRYDDPSPFLLPYQSATEVVDAILAENAARETPLYSTEDLIAVAVDAGFPAEVTDAWRETYVPPPEPECGREARRRCRERCMEQCPKPLLPWIGEARGHCLGPCLARCAKIKACPGERQSKKCGKQHEHRRHGCDKGKADDHRGGNTCKKKGGKR